MTLHEKIQYWFLIIITFGLIFLYWKTKKNKVKNELSTKSKISININKIILLLGDVNNIKKIESSNTKIKIYFENKEKIKVDNIKKVNGVSGVFVTSSYIQLIVGKEAHAIEKKINSII